MSARSATATGFQLTDTALHAVSLARSRSGVRLRQAFTVELDHPVDPVLLGGESGREALVAALSKAAEQLAGNFGQIRVGLGHGGYLFKEGPVLNPDARSRRGKRENAEQLRWEMEQFLGEELVLYAVDTVSVGETGYAVAARLAVLDLYARVFADASLAEPRFDIDPFALHNAAEAAGLLNAEQTVLVASQTERSCDVLLVRGGQLAAVTHSARRNPGKQEIVSAAARMLEQHTEADDDGLQVDAAWVAGDHAGDVCAALAARVPCACQPLPWEQAAGSQPQGPDSPALAVAGGLAMRSLLA